MNRPSHIHRISYGALVALAVLLMQGVGCVEMRSAHTTSCDYDQRQIPVDPPACIDGRPKYDDFVQGGQLFKMYCGSCHDARPLGDRSFAETEVAFAHMRQHAYLTGKEYRQLIHFLRRWQDVGPATAEIPSNRKRFFYSQPISELPPCDEALSSKSP